MFGRTVVKRDSVATVGIIVTALALAFGVIWALPGEASGLAGTGDLASTGDVEDLRVFDGAAAYESMSAGLGPEFREAIDHQRSLLGEPLVGRQLAADGSDSVLAVGFTGSSCLVMAVDGQSGVLTVCTENSKALESGLLAHWDPPGPGALVALIAPDDAVELRGGPSKSVSLSDGYAVVSIEVAADARSLAFADASGELRNLNLGDAEVPAGG